MTQMKACTLRVLFDQRTHQTSFEGHEFTLTQFDKCVYKYMFTLTSLQSCALSHVHSPSPSRWALLYALFLCRELLLGYSFSLYNTPLVRPRLRRVGQEGARIWGGIHAMRHCFNYIDGRRISPLPRHHCPMPTPHAPVRPTLVLVRRRVRYLRSWLCDLGSFGRTLFGAGKSRYRDLHIARQEVLQELDELGMFAQDLVHLRHSLRDDCRILSFLVLI